MADPLLCCVARLRFVALPVAMVCLVHPPLSADDDIPPVRVGDKVQVLSFSTWYDGTVESFQEGVATVTYQWSTVERSGEFPLEKMRFPNGEGHWMVWKDATGKFRVEARYISRTETDVTIRKADQTEVTVPIASLHPSIRKQVSQTPVTSDITAPVHVGDEVEVQYFSKWYEGTVTSVNDDKIVVEYQDGSSTKSWSFKLKDIRFPNGEGHWMIWKDATGKFKVEGRYISRTATDVTIRRTDGTDLTVPIKSLRSDLRQQLAKTKITSELNTIDGVVPIRAGDRVQVRSGSSWYDGTVKEVKGVGASVQYDLGTWGIKTSVFDLQDIRYPNGEGHWREWSNSSGDFKIMARYMARDLTHVTILKEDGSEIRVPIDQLSTQLQQLLRKTPIIARRPPVVSLAGAELIGDLPDPRPSPAARLQTVQNQLAPTSGGNAPDLATLSIDVGTPASQQTVSLPQGGAAFAIEPKYTIGKVVPIGGEDGWVAVSVKGDKWTENLRTRLSWVSLANRKAVAGPQFYPDQQFLAYSEPQKRAVMCSVKGTWNEPYQLSTYRIVPGQAAAQPEKTINIPKKKYTFNREPIRVELIGKNHMLVGYGGMVSLWDLGQPRVLYQVGGLKSHAFQLSIDHHHFAVPSANTTISVHEVATGQLTGQGNWEGFGATTACFSRDGKRLVVASKSGFYRWDLSRNHPLETLPLGGIDIDQNTPLADLGGGWLVAGPQIYSSGLGLIVWRYDGGDLRTRALMAMKTGAIDPRQPNPAKGVSIKYQQMLGRQMLVAATAGDANQKSVLVGVATVPHKDAIEMMKKVDPETIRMLVPGSRIKIDTSVDARILKGLRRAAADNQWVEDPASEVLLTGSAKSGKTEQLTYRVIGSGGMGEETHSVSPWIQTVQVIYQDKTAWYTSMGGVPFSVRVPEGQSLGGELQKSGNASYALFESLKIPEEIIYPRYQLGLGQTLLTPKGFVDIAK